MVDFTLLILDVPLKVFGGRSNFCCAEILLFVVLLNTEIALSLLIYDWIELDNIVHTYLDVHSVEWRYPENSRAPEIIWVRRWEVL